MFLKPTEFVPSTVQELKVPDAGVPKAGAAEKESVPLPFVTKGCPAVPSAAGNVNVVVAAVLGPAKLTAPPKVA